MAKKLKKAEEYNSTLISDLVDSIGIDIRLRVSNEIGLINFLTDNGFRKSGYWDAANEEDEKLRQAISVWAQQQTAWQLEDIKEWEANGRPE